MRRTLTSTLAVAALTCAALSALPATHAQPAWTHTSSISGVGPAPTGAKVAVADNGSAVAVWTQDKLGVRQVLAASASKGVWGPVHVISADPEDASSSPNVALNEKGEAVVTWLRKDNLDNTRLYSARRLPGGSWDGHTIVSPPNLDVVSPGPVAIDPAGRMVATYGVHVAPGNQVRAIIQNRGSATYTSRTLSDNDSFLPVLDMNDAGTALVAWYDVEGAQSQISSSRLSAGNSTWGVERQVDSLGTHGTVIDVAVSDQGLGTVVHTRQFEGDSLVASNKVDTAGLSGGTSFVSPTGQDASAPDLDVNATGQALVTWVYDTGQGKGVGVARRPQTSSWTQDSLNAVVAAPAAPRAAIADNGTEMVAWTGNGRLVAAHRVAGAGTFTNGDFGAQGFVPGSTALDMDAQGNALSAAVMLAPDPAQGQVFGSFLDTAGPWASLGQPASQVTAVKFGLAWTASDRLSPVKNSTLRVRSAAWNAGFGGWTTVASQAAGTSRSFTGAPGRTYCFQVHAKDAFDNAGAWSAQRCTTTPLDDRSLGMAKGFTRATSTAMYRGTYTKTTTKGATLTRTGVRAKRIALLVSKVANGGTVKVTLGTANLGTFSLKGAGNRKFINVTTFSGVRTGKLAITVTSPTGRVVRIDGVVLAK